MSRSTLKRVVLGVALLAACVLGLPAPAASADGKVIVFLGDREDGGTIHRCTLDLATGALSQPQVAAKVKNPSFQAIHPSGKYLYSVCELYGPPGPKGGAVCAFAVEPKTGTLTLLNRRPSGGRGPCHISVTPDGTYVLGANYGGGSVFVLPVGTDGRLGKASAFVQHEGKSADPRRQKGPHAHSFNPDKAGRLVFAADLGLDKILIYRLDAAKGTLTPNDPPFVKTAPGAGPRHFSFHPSGTFAYVINELNSTVTAFAYDAKAGRLTPIQSVSTLPKDFTERNSCAEVLVHPSGKFVYGSNRGHDSIAVFAVNAETGKLTPRGQTATRGKTPRNFRIDPTGQYLLAANQNTGNVVVFRINAKTGALTPTGSVVDVKGPTCVRMLPVGSE